MKSTVKVKAYVFILVYMTSFHLIRVKGLSCYDCSYNAGEQCKKIKRCETSESICSYLVENSQSGRRPSMLRSECEQENSCITNNRQNSNLQNQKCKYCCKKDKCNIDGPKRCEKRSGTGNCRSLMPRQKTFIPVVFCRKRKGSIKCSSQVPFKQLVNSSYLYIANFTNDEEVAGCRKKHQGIENSGESVKATIQLQCTRIESSSRQSILKQLGLGNFRRANNFTRVNRMTITCNKFVIEDYKYDWKCSPETFTCSFIFTPITTTMPTSVTNATAALVTSGVIVDVWMYIIVAIVVGGVLLFVGFAKHIARAIKNRRLLRIQPESKRLSSRKEGHSSRLIHVNT